MTASRGSAAPATTCGEAVDLMIDDPSVPGNGLKLTKEAWGLRPSLPVILLTGYAVDASALASSGSASLLQRDAERSASRHCWNGFTRRLSEAGARQWRRASTHSGSGRGALHLSLLDPAL